MSFLEENQALSEPKTIKAKILRDIIVRPYISERDYKYNSFRIRLSEIRADLLANKIVLQSKWREFKNEFGRPGQYKVYYILYINRKKAKKVYEILNNANISI